MATDKGYRAAAADENVISFTVIKVLEQKDMNVCAIFHSSPSAGY